MWVCIDIHVYVYIYIYISKLAVLKSKGLLNLTKLNITQYEFIMGP